MTYSGQSVKRHEDHRLLTGQSAYVDDIKLPSGCWYSSEVQLAQGDANEAGQHREQRFEDIVIPQWATTSNTSETTRG